MLNKYSKIYTFPQRSHNFGWKKKETIPWLKYILENKFGSFQLHIFYFSMSRIMISLCILLLKKS